VLRPPTLILGVTLNLVIGLSGLAVAGSLGGVVSGAVPAPAGMNVQGAAAAIALGIGAYGFGLVLGAVGLFRGSRLAWIVCLVLDALGLAILGLITWRAGLDLIFVTGLLVWGLATLAVWAAPTRRAVSG
jgi:hypothetical protein